MARPRIGKSGAQRIGEILDDPDSELNRQITTAGKGFFASQANPEASPSQKTLGAVRATRSQYRSLGRRIAAIDTGRKGAKQDVLNALNRYDAALGAYAKALPNHGTQAGASALVSAARKAKTAAKDLETARSKLK